MIGVHSPRRRGRVHSGRILLADALHRLEPFLLPSPDSLTTDSPVFTLQQGVQLPIISKAELTITPPYRAPLPSTMIFKVFIMMNTSRMREIFLI